MKFPNFLFWTCMSEISKREFRLYISLDCVALIFTHLNIKRIIDDYSRDYPWKGQLFSNVVTQWRMQGGRSDGLVTWGV